MIRFAKILEHARPPERLNEADPGATIFSAENFNLEYGEVHGFRTGIVLEVPPGKNILINETNAMGLAGVTVAGGTLTPNDVGEVRVNLMNNHRNALQIKAGEPVGWLTLVDATEEDEFEEYDLEGLTNEMKAVAEEALKASRKRRAEAAAKAADEAASK